MATANMPIRFACEKCGQRLSVSSRKAGVAARCPKCRQRIRVPDKSAEATAKPEEAEEKSNATEEHSEDAKRHGPPQPPIPPPPPTDGEPAVAERRGGGLPDAAGGSDADASTKADSVPSEAPSSPSSEPPNPAQPDAAPPAPSDEPSEVDPYSEFAVYDDDIEWEYESPEFDSARETTERPVHKVAVPRSMLYAQGVLIGVVALVSFVLGMLAAGQRSPAEREPIVAQICSISGRVAVETNGLGNLPDEGAVVIAVPKDESPTAERRADVAGLRPSDPIPNSSNPGVTALRELGGAYTRADAEGRFSLRVAAGDYFVLVLSAGKYRAAGEAPPRNDLAQLGRYFLPATELLGESRYEWSSVTIRRDQTLDVVF